MININSKQNIVAQLAGVKSFPCTDFKTKNPKTDDKGRQQYAFRIQIPGLYRLETYPVKVYSASDPIDGAQMGDSVELGGVTAVLGYLTDEEGKQRQFWSLTADSVALKKA